MMFENKVVRHLENMIELYRKKNAQYGTGGDALANLRTAAQLEYESDNYASMYCTCKSFMAKHVAHVYNSDIDGDKVAESLRDIAVYCAMLLALVEKYEEDGYGE